MKQLSKKQKMYILNDILDTLEKSVLAVFICNEAEDLINLELHLKRDEIEREELIERYFPELKNFVEENGKKFSPLYSWGKAWTNEVGRIIKNKIKADLLKEFIEEFKKDDFKAS